MFLKTKKICFALSTFSFIQTICTQYKKNNECSIIIRRITSTLISCAGAVAPGSLCLHLLFLSHPTPLLSTPTPPRFHKRSRSIHPSTRRCHSCTGRSLRTDERREAVNKELCRLARPFTRFLFSHPASHRCRAAGRCMGTAG